MAKHSHDVIILGGGAGGLTVAAGCAQLGMKTALIDKERLGGDCLYYGCVPSKTLLKTASVHHLTGQAERFGLPRIDQPPVDMSAVNTRIASVVREIEKHDSPERFENLGAEVLFGSATFASPNEIRLNDEHTLSAPKIVLATGSSPATIPVPGLEEAGYTTNVDAFSLPSLPRRLVTIGAGPIGVELSQAFARLGANVTIIDIAPQVLPHEDADMAAVVRERLEADAITLRLGVSVARVESANGSGAAVSPGAIVTPGVSSTSGAAAAPGRVKRIILATDSGEEVIEADEILLAVGRKGNTDGLGLDIAGVEVEAGFVKVDSKLRTSQKHILAVGDVNGRFLFTHVAGAEGSVAVRRLALHMGASMNYQRVPWVTYSDPEFASVGYNEARAKEAGIAYKALIEPFSSSDRALAEGEPHGKIKVLLDAKERVIGTQIVAHHAGDLIIPSLFAVGSSWKPRNLMGPIYPYPTMGEIHRKIASNHMAPKLFNDRVRGILRFLFRHRGTGGEGYK